MVYILYYAVLQYCDTKLTCVDDSVAHAVRLYWGLLWESADKYEYVTLPYCFGKIAIVAGVGTHTEKKDLIDSIKWEHWIYF